MAISSSATSVSRFHHSLHSIPEMMREFIERFNRGERMEPVAFTLDETTERPVGNAVTDGRF